MTYTVITATGQRISEWPDLLSENYRTSRFLNALDKTADFTVWADDTGGNPLDVYYVDCTSGNVTVTLPALSSTDAAAGRMVKIVRVDNSANDVIIDADGSETIEGATTVTLENQWDVQTIRRQSATNWAVMQGRLGAPTVSPAYGEIYVASGAGSQTIGNSYTKVNQFTANGTSSGTTADHTNDKITATDSGTYRVSLAISFKGTNSATFTIAVYAGGVEQANLHLKRKLNSSGEVGSAMLSGLATLAASDDVEVYVKANGTSKNFAVEEANLTISKVSS